MDIIEQRFRALIPEHSLVPADVIWSFIEGKKHPETGAKDETYFYTPEQQARLLALAEIGKNTRIHKLPSFARPLWISGAGGPGAGKSTALLQFIAAHYAILERIPQAAWREASLRMAIDIIGALVPAVWVSADRRNLLDLTEVMGHPGVSDKDFYSLWRWGTNGLSNLDLSLAHAGKKNVVHDTTLAGFSNLPKAREAGFYTVAVPTASPFDTRNPASDERNETFFQCFARNVTAQDQDFGVKFPANAAHANEVHYMWRDGIHDTARPVALVKDNEKIAIYDEAGFAGFRALYPPIDQAVGQLRRDDALESEIPGILRRQAMEIPNGRAPGGPSLT